MSDSLVEQIRQSYTERRDQIQLSEMASKIYESSVNASYALINLVSPENVKYLGGYTYQQKKSEYQERFFYFTERRKGAILFSSLAESNAKSFGGIPDTLLSKEKTLKTLINNYTQELAANPNPEMVEFYQRELFKANRSYEKLLMSFENDYPKYYDLKYDVGIVKLQELSSFLSDSTMILSYFDANDSLYVAQIDKSGLNISKVYKSNSFEKSVKAFRKGIIYKSEALYKYYGNKLYQQLFPMEIPSHISNLIIVPDGIMATIPFEALLTESTMGKSLNYNELPYLVNRFNISYTFSANLLYRTFMNEKIIREKAQKDALLLAPVSFDHSLKALKLAKENSYNESNRAKNLRKGISIPAEEIVPLPATEIEVDEIDTLFSRYNKNVDSWKRYMAQEDKVKEGLLQDYQYIHLASHGFVNQEEPEFSGIFLNADSVKKKEDGVLFSGEVYNIDLNAELVSLSACETGLGKISTGEGIIGLSRALLYAGAKNLAVSLWKVSDEATKDLMVGFYDDFIPIPTPSVKTKSIDYAPSLREAKLKMISDTTYSHPYYWSPFILIGK